MKIMFEYTKDYAFFQSCYVMDLLADCELGQSILRMGVQLSKNNNINNSQTTARNGDVISNDVNKTSELCDVEDELSQCVVFILFTVCWKGVDTCDDAAWSVSFKHQHSCEYCTRFM